MLGLLTRVVAAERFSGGRVVLRDQGRKFGAERVGKSEQQVGQVAIRVVDEEGIAGIPSMARFLDQGQQSPVVPCR